MSSTSTTTDSSNEFKVKPKKVVIAGAGVIGTSTAYYLAQNHASSISSITVVDTTGTIAPAASGKAGGFLALDWNDASPIRQLARRSFELHSTLASKLGSEKIMYRRLTCAAISVDPNAKNRRRPGGKKLEGVEWADDGKDDSNGNSAVLGIQNLGDESTIAQVHPKMLCDAMWDEVVKNERVDAKLVRGEVLKPIFSVPSPSDNDINHEKGTKVVTGVELQDGQTIEADVLLYACGPWTSYAYAKNIMSGVKYHSVIIPSRPRILNQAVFFDGCGDPEIYPRPDGTAYCTGFPDGAIKVEERPGEEKVREEAVQRIVKAVREASGENGVLSAEPEVKQSCYLPSTPDGLPIMGSLGDEEDGKGLGCFVAAGHSCWGILLGPGTGETMASLIATGASTDYVNLAPFRPERFQNVNFF